MTAILRNTLSGIFRALPQFRGKARLGAAISHVLTDTKNSQDCIVNITMHDGSVMRLDVRSRTEIWAYWTGEYDSGIMNRLSSCLRPGAVVLDIGANVGFYTSSLGNRLKALNGKLYAFEPVPNNFNRLVDVIRLNGLEQTVYPFNIALGNEEGTITMRVETENNAETGNAIMARRDGVVDDAHKVCARITCLDSFAARHQIEACHLIKIDIEGAEVLFLMGAAKFLSTHRPIIYGEFAPPILKKFGHSFLDAAAIVAQWDYRIFKLINRSQFVEVTQPQIGLSDMLLVPGDTPDSILAQLGVTGL